MKIKKIFEVPVDPEPQYDHDVLERIAPALIQAAQEPGVIGAECEFDGVTLYAERRSTAEQIFWIYQKTKSDRMRRQVSESVRHFKRVSSR